MKAKLARLALLATPALLGTMSAHAAIDVTAVVDEIEATYAAAGPIPTLGAAVLLVVVALLAFKWVRRAMT